MNDDQDIVGAKGGGKKGGAGNSTSAANTLRSRTRVKVVEIISEGPIKGLKNGAKSIYLNQTAVQNADGSYNFNNVNYQEHKGYADDTHFNGHNAVENIVSVEAQVKLNTGPVVRTIVEPTADAVKVVVRVNSLFKVDEKSGKLNTNNVSYAVEYRSFGGGWITAFYNDIVNEKCTSPTQIQHRIELPNNGAPWDIRVRRISGDSPDDKDQSDIYFEGYSVLVEGKFTYPHSAAIAIELNAEDIGSQIPTRAYHVEGRLLQIPSNYNPVTRVYTGIWNGTFTTAYSNNPAWVFFDMVDSDIFGIGDLVDISKVDKWALYTIAQYCDVQVPSGYGSGTEPRYTFNGVIKNRKEAFYVLQSMTQTWRGMGYWSLGQMFVTADMPADPVRLMTPANVINGEFTYASTSAKSRHSVVLVRWNDPNNFYAPATECVVDDDMVRLYGWREKTVELEGCTSRSLARRYGKWIIDTEKNSTETISFAASWDQLTAMPGQIIAVNDPRKANVRLGGRVKSHSGDSIYLDYNFEPVGGATYQVMYTLPDGSVVTKPVLQTYADKTRLRIGTVTTFAEANAMFVIISSTVAPRQYRIISIEEGADAVLNITGVFHDPTKYSRVELNIKFDAPPYTQAIGKSKPPINLLLTETSFRTVDKLLTRINLSWTAPSSTLVARYLILSDTPTQKSVAFGSTASTTFDIDLTDIGAYKFSVQTVDIFGNTSDPVSVAYTLLGATGFAAGVVTNLVNAATNQSGITTFSGTTVKIKWNNMFTGTTVAGVTDSVPSAQSSPLFLRNTISVYAAVTNTLLRTESVLTPSYSYDLASNSADCITAGISGPVRSLRFDVVVTDVVGRNSAITSITLTNAPPAMFNPVVQVNGANLQITWPPQTDEDYVSTVVWVETNNTYDPLVTPHYYDGVGSFTYVGFPSTTYYIRAASYDVFGKSGMNISPFVTATTLAAFDFTPPDTPTGLVLNSSIINGEAVMVASWTANTELDLAYYDVAVRQSTGTTVSFQTATNVIEWVVLPGVQYFVSLRAVDGLGNSSNFTTEANHTAATDTTAAAVPTGLTATGAFASVWLKWNANTEKDLLGYEVYESAATTAPLLATAASFFSQATTINRGALPVTATTRYYWIRSLDTSGNRSAWSAMATAITLVVDTTVTSTDLTGLVDATSFATTIKPVEIVAALPIAPHVQGRQVFLTTDNKVYRNTGAGWSVAVDGADIVASSIIAGKIATGAISADQIAAGAITAEKLLIGDTSNMVLNDWSKGSLGGWTVAAQLGFAEDNTIGASSGWKFSSNARDQAFSPLVSVSVGEQIYLSAWVYNSATESASLYLNTKTPAGVDGWVTLAAASTVAKNTWVRLQGIFAVPAGIVQARMLLQVNKTVTGGLTTFWTKPVMRRASDSVMIADGAITSAKVTTGTLLTASAQIQDAIVTNAKIVDLDASKITASTVLAGSILVGTTALSAVVTQAADPAAKVNTGLTQIDPGKILISGSTTLSSWRNGTDSTKIEGGNIAANTISANKLSIGSRNITVSQIQFEANSPVANSVEWTAGTIAYVSDAGTSTAAAIIAGSAAWTTGIIYIYWVKGGTALLTTTVLATALADNNVVLGSYAGDVALITEYGRTIIDGSFIKTGSITATQIAAGAITATQIAANTITASQIAAATVTADRLVASGGGNLIKNSDFGQGTHGFAPTWADGAVGASTTMDLRAPGATWAGRNFPTLAIFQSDAATVGSYDVSTVGMNAAGTITNYGQIAVTPSKKYYFSFRLSLHRCNADVIYQWYGADNLPIGTPVSRLFLESAVGAGSSTNPDSWFRGIFAGFSPAGATNLMMTIRKYGTLSGTSSYVFFCQPQLELSHSGSGDATPYKSGLSTIIDGGNIVTNSITAASITTGAITADKIAAGAITAENISVGYNANLLPNTDFKQSSAGWGKAGTGGINTETTIFRQLPNSGWSGSTYPTMYIVQNGVATDGYADFRSYDYNAAGSNLSLRAFAVEPGKYYAVAAQLSLHRCTATIRIAFYTWDNVYIAGTEVAADCTGDAGSSTNPDEWQKYWVKGVAPPTAAFAALIVRKSGTLSGTNSYVFIHKPLAVLSSAYITEPPNYSNSATTFIDGSNLRTGTVTAAQITAGSITADRLVAGTITAASAVLGDASVTTLKIAGQAVNVFNIAAVGAVTHIPGAGQWISICGVGISRTLGFGTLVKFDYAVARAMEFDMYAVVGPNPWVNLTNLDSNNWTSATLWDGDTSGTYQAYYLWARARYRAGYYRDTVLGQTYVQPSWSRIDVASASISVIQVKR